MGSRGEVTAEVLSIGDELLIGQTINTNAAWLGAQLSLIGIRPIASRTIGDDREQILEALAATTANVVLLTGGLGPTKDDITKHTLCTFFNTPLQRRPEVEKHIEDLFLKMGRDPATLQEVNRAQADLPVACTVVPNAYGTASGMWFEREGRVFISMPGVPYEMKGIMVDNGLRMLKSHFRPPTIVHRTLLTAGLGESLLAERIADWEDGLAPLGIKLAYLPSPGMVKLRLSSYGNQNAQEAQERINARAEELYRRIPDLIFGEGNLRLEQAIGSMLKERGQSLALAESCTGGYLSHLVTAVPGSSAYYIGGVVSYANAVKMEELGIPSDMLELNGAVSRPVAERMAQGVREALRSDWALATTGIAGPDGGTPEKPVGTVWVAVAGPNGVSSRLGSFPGGRSLVIERAAMSALNMLRKALVADHTVRRKG
jgi:nicotinamide-nucleotide amidase